MGAKSAFRSSAPMLGGPALLLCSVLTVMVSAASASGSFERLQLPDSTWKLHHIHIAKTGGTAVDAMLRSAFQGIAPFTSTEHPAWEPNRPHGDYEIILLRDPSNWLFSAIYHDLGMGRIQSNNISQSFTLTDAVDPSRRLRGKFNSTGYDLRNFQSKRIVHPSVSNPMERIKLAREFINKIAVVGVSEHMAQSMCLVYYRFSHPNFARCNCSRNIDVVARNTRLSDDNYQLFAGSPTYQLRAVYAELVQASKLLDEDRIVYSIALQRFIRDVELVQQATGFQLFCS